MYANLRNSNQLRCSRRSAFALVPTRGSSALVPAGALAALAVLFSGSPERVLATPSSGVEESGALRTLCPVAVPNGDLEANCYEVGEELTINVELGFGASVVTGGQFFVPYDPDVLQFVDAAPGSAYDPESPFCLELHYEVDEEAGFVFYAVTIDPFADPPGSQGPAVMATMQFAPRVACSQTELCFGAQAPLYTALTDDSGTEAPYIHGCCTDVLYFETGEPPTLNCPESVEVKPNASEVSTLVTWDPITVADDCEHGLRPVCTATHSHGINIDHLIAEGGVFSTGLSQFECVTCDSCGHQGTCSWHVRIGSASILRPAVHAARAVSVRP